MREIVSALVPAMVMVGAESPSASRSGSSAARVLSGERERTTPAKVVTEYRLATEKVSATSLLPAALVRMASAEEVVVFPLKTRTGLLVLLALGRMVSANCAWLCSSGAKESNVAATTKALNAKPLRFAGGGGGGGTLYFHQAKQLIVRLKDLLNKLKVALFVVCSPQRVKLRIHQKDEKS